jgi:hypothetical protein
MARIDLYSIGLLFAAACSIPPLDEHGKTCLGTDPCPSGLLCIGGRCGGAPDAGALMDGFVQQSYATPQVDAQEVRAVLMSPQSAGHLNIVVVGWNDTTSRIAEVFDDSSNTYARAMGPTTSGIALSQAMYYAKSIRGAASNGVTVMFDRPARFVDLRVLEYAGLDPDAPFDVATGGGGQGIVADTGPITISSAPELLFVAGSTTNAFVGDGASFVIRVVTVPDMDIAGDRVESTNGSFSLTASLQSSANWVLQVAAFR